MKILPLLLTLFSTGSSFILAPDDLVSLMNAFYSRVPPIRIGMNNTKVGLGFRMGRNVDVQFLVELGPQDAPRPTDSSKREAPTAKNAESTAQNKWPAVNNPVITDQNKWPAVQNPLKTRNRWPAVHNPVTTDQNKMPTIQNPPATDQKKLPATQNPTKSRNRWPAVNNPVTTNQNKRPAVQDPATTVLNWWPAVRNPLTTVKPAIALPIDFISRLRRMRPGITSSTTRRPETTTEVLTTELDVKENEIDSENT